MNITPVLQKYNINFENGINKAVYDTSVYVNNATSRLSAANKIIVDLGSPRVSKERHAVVMSQALVEQAVLNRLNFDASNAHQAAKERYEKLLVDMPWSFVDSTDKPTSTPRVRKSTDRESPQDNNKKRQALVIFNENKDKTNGEIAKIISTALEITYANAYYYVSRVFKR